MSLLDLEDPPGHGDLAGHIPHRPSGERSGDGQEYYKSIFPLILFSNSSKY